MFIHWLQRRLTRELPGPSAHAQIWSYPRNSVAEGLTLNPPPRASAVAMILQPISDLHFELLYIVRSPFGIHGSQVAFPGGKIEKEEDALGCACRETLEEIGIELQSKQCIGQLSPVFIPPSHMIVYPQVFVLYNKIENFNTTHEVDHVFWIDQQKIAPENIMVKDHYLKAFDETRPIKGIALNDHFLWGASAMLTMELMTLHQEFSNEMNAPS